MIRSREEVSELVRRARDGDEIAFRELELVAKPLLVSLSRKFTKYHNKFEFEDLYSIALNSLYKACVSYNERNPSFLDYAKLIIIRDFWREIKYWNAKRRNSFEFSEVPIDSVSETLIFDNSEEFDIEIIKSDVRDNISVIITECFDARKGEMLRRYFIENHRVIDIANDMDIKYKNVYSVVNRGMNKIVHEYRKRHNP
jgi:RNA polymerase sigma factor (sigma-70 family)